jgi:hypothetical protein
MITSILIVAAVLVLVLSPVIIAALITAGHAILGTNRPRTAGYLQPAAA